LKTYNKNLVYTFNMKKTKEIEKYLRWKVKLRALTYIKRFGVGSDYKP